VDLLHTENVCPHFFDELYQLQALILLCHTTYVETDYFQGILGLLRTPVKRDEVIDIAAYGQHPNHWHPYKTSLEDEPKQAEQDVYQQNDGKDQSDEGH
jgi:hypothetical protein